MFYKLFILLDISGVFDFKRHKSVLISCDYAEFAPKDEDY